MLNVAWSSLIAMFPPQPAGPNWTSGGSDVICLCSEKVLVPLLVGGVMGQDWSQRCSSGWIRLDLELNDLKWIRPRPDQYQQAQKGW